jgi:hypothetical protein
MLRLRAATPFLAPRASVASRQRTSGEQASFA